MQQIPIDWGWIWLMVIPSVANHPRDANTKKPPINQQCAQYYNYFYYYPQYYLFHLSLLYSPDVCTSMFYRQNHPQQCWWICHHLPKFLDEDEVSQESESKRNKRTWLIQKPNISCEDRIPTPFHRTKTPAVGHSAVLLLRGASDEIHITKLEIFSFWKTWDFFWRCKTHSQLRYL